MGLQPTAAPDTSPRAAEARVGGPAIGRGALTKRLTPGGTKAARAANGPHMASVPNASGRRMAPVPHAYGQWAARSGVSEWFGGTSPHLRRASARCRHAPSVPEGDDRRRGGLSMSGAPIPGVGSPVGRSAVRLGTVIRARCDVCRMLRAERRQDFGRAARERLVRHFAPRVDISSPPLVQTAAAGRGLRGSHRRLFAGQPLAVGRVSG